MNLDEPQSSAPVAIIMFNRPELTRQVAERVAQAKPQAVYLIADGPRPSHPTDVEACQATRDAVMSINWPCPVFTNFAEENLGLRRRVSTGLDWLFESVDAAIILEDDCLADSSFFPFATELLDRFRDDERVGLVSGNNFLRGARINDDSYFFASDARIWGWATWRRVWQDFSDSGLSRFWSEEEAQKVVSQLGSHQRQRDLVSDVGHIGQIDSWALPFVLHSLSRGYLNVVPRVNLVSNIGFGADSTHTKFENFVVDIPAESIDFPLTHPADVSDSPEAGRLEERISKRQWLWFPLRHPIDFLGRLFRYARVIASSR